MSIVLVMQQFLASGHGSPGASFKHSMSKNKLQKHKTYNTGDPLVVTDLTTNPAVYSLACKVSDIHFWKA